MMAKKRLVVGISGASGAPLALHLLTTMRKQPEWEIHLVITRGGEKTIAEELNMDRRDFESLCDDAYDSDAIGAVLASGSFPTAGMMVIPCSMKTVAGICSGYTDNLLLRAADVTLKEGRPLVLVPREAPLSPVHLRNLYELSQMGVFIVPPMLTYYNHQKTVEDMEHSLICRALGYFGIEIDRQLIQYSPIPHAFPAAP
jgi:polyprenyl P-hydroxybenzoate/phenylacrylic acid decarboxylase-like protein